uniref:FmdB family transcriptional regulator n=1 Tax=Schlesneria paludicola TaxID=360056 RepID=A0A7C2PG49_9PLAN
MPLYVYEEVRADGQPGETYEFLQGIHEPALTTHPQTGVPIRRKLTAAWTPKPFGKHDKKEQLSDRNLEKLGFTKYVKGKSGYEKTAGDGPELIKRP